MLGKFLVGFLWFYFILGIFAFTATLGLGIIFTAHNIMPSGIISIVIGVMGYIGLWFFRKLIKGLN